MQTSADRRVAELETTLAEKNAKLDSYHKLEAELDDVVLQAAQGKLDSYHKLEAELDDVVLQAAQGKLDWYLEL